MKTLRLDRIEMTRPGNEGMAFDYHKANSNLMPDGDWRAEGADISLPKSGENARMNPDEKQRNQTDFPLFGRSGGRSTNDGGATQKSMEAESARDRLRAAKRGYASEVPAGYFIPEVLKQESVLSSGDFPDANAASALIPANTGGLATPGLFELSCSPPAEMR